jgi:hypothetical protein
LLSIVHKQKANKPAKQKSNSATQEIILRKQHKSNPVKDTSTCSKRHRADFSEGMPLVELLNEIYFFKKSLAEGNRTMLLRYRADMI